MKSTQEVVPFVPEEHADALTLPGVVTKDGNSFYVQAPLQVFLSIVGDKAQEIQDSWVVWFGKDATTVGGVQQQWVTLADAVRLATQLANEKAQLADGKATQAQTAADKANQAAQRVETAVEAAGNVDAELDGMTVTITNRQGQSKQTNIGFEIYNTYGSVAEMQADADNVPKGKFVTIATIDPTSEENARLYSKNSAGGFSFLCDLDQAASHAWADWLENHKQQIQQATDHANEQGDYAKEQGDYAKEQGNYAKGIYDTVRQWFNGTDNNGFKATSENWLSTIQQTWESWFSDSLSTGVRKIWEDFYTLVTTTFASWKTQEQGRVDAESARVKAETQRDTNEQTRQQQETARQQAETERGTNEQARQQAETQRNTNEQTRQQQEEARQTATARAISNAETATDHANSQARYAENVADHPSYIADGSEDKPGDVGYVYQWNYAAQQYVRGKRIALDWNSMSQDEKDALAAEVLAKISFDDEPTPGSNRAVRSSGIYQAIAEVLAKKQDVLTFASEDTSKAIVDELT